MKVTDLAEELQLPASTILQQCQRFGIDAAWAGAELSGADLVVLRAELASIDATDLGPTDPPGAEPMAAAPVDAAGGGKAPTAVLPPTAVGSMPDLIDDVTPPADPPSPPSRGLPSAGGPVDPASVPGVKIRTAPVERKLDRAARTALLALAVGVVAFAASNLADQPVAVAALWLLAAAALIVAFYDSVRGRRHVQTHPERVSGLWLSTIVLVLAAAGIIGLTVSVVTVVGSDPASDAPGSVGDLQSVQVARWGYQRAKRLQENGWKEPARQVHTCWIEDDDEARDRDRVELPDLTDQQLCRMEHSAEVARVFAYNREADAIYPGTEGFVAAAQKVCQPLYEKAVAKDPKVALKLEYPTEIGWSDGDHDVACLLVTAPRKGALTS